MKLKTFGELDKEILEISSYYNMMFSAGEKVVVHAHNSFEIMLAKNGSFAFGYQDEKKRRTDITLLEGQFVLINAGTYHDISFNDKCRILNVEFLPVEAAQEERLTLTCAELFGLNSALRAIRDKNLPYYVFEDFQSVDQEILRLTQEPLLDGPEKIIEHRIRLLSVLTAVSRCTLYETNKKIGIVYVKKAMEHIRDNFRKELSVKSVAGHCGVNPDYLQRLVKKAIGKNVLQLINEYRISYAKMLVSNKPDIKMDELSLLCGYAGRLSLNYEFKKLTGKTVGEFKDELKSPKFRSEEFFPHMRRQHILDPP